MQLTKICPNCDSEFKTYKSVNKKCCNRKCNDELTKKQSYEKYKKICEVCEIEFLPPRQAEGGRFCSYKCSGIADRKDRIDRNGYWYVYLPKHENASKQGYVPEHHLIMEREIKRIICAGEVVHHINEDKKDNRIDNLQLMSDSDHKSLHAKNRSRAENGRLK